MIGIEDYLRAAEADGDWDAVEYYEDLIADHKADEAEAMREERAGEGED